ncbi:MAG: serine hydrolase domain-containing protein [Anaerolineae bacterium]
MKPILRLILLLPVLLFSLVVHAQDDVAAQLDALIADIAPADGPAVSARITIGDETWAAAGGLVDVAGDTSATPDDRFRIGSISKTFVAVTIMQLVEEGVLSLDDYLSDWVDAAILDDLANAGEVTLYQLLTMTAGIPEYFDDEFFDAIYDDPTHEWSPGEVLDFARYQDAYFEPGDGFEYVNTNYILLQLVVQEATGTRLHEAVRERILDPLELNDTYSQIHETLPGEFVHGYEDIEGDDTPEDVTLLNDGAGLGDGAIVSTTADLTRFYQGLFIEGQLLDDDSLDAMLDAADEETEYGIGLEVFDSDYGLLVGHTGAVFGFTGAIFYAEELDTIVTILYASDSLDMDDVFALLDIAASSGVE